MASPLFVTVFSGLAVVSSEAVQQIGTAYRGDPVTSLPRLNISTNDISVSGVSAGGDFTVQFQVAYSSLLRGSAIIAGQPYHCALTFFPGEGGSKPAMDHCKHNPGIVNVSQLVEYAQDEAAAGSIDGLSNLKSARVYLFEGTKDTLYNGSAKLVAEFFSHFLDPAVQMKIENSVPCPHAWPTLDTTGYGLEACGYDAAGEALSHIYGQLRSPASPSADSFRAYDQAPFQDGSLNKEGYVYIPRACEQGNTCRLHVNLHGCGPWKPKQIHDIGLNRWAESNDIVVVYPLRYQCWDAYGNHGPDYALRNGRHMATVRNIISAISGI